MEKEKLVNCPNWRLVRTNGEGEAGELSELELGSDSWKRSSR
ncbi:hypothetical protein [Evansella tamaricis]